MKRIPKWGWAVALLVAIAVIFLVVLVLRGGNTDSEEVISPTDVTEVTQTPAELASCDTGEGVWELQNLHGEDGKVLNDGADNIDAMVDAAKRDPLVLRLFLLEYLSASLAGDQGILQVVARVQLEEEIPSVEELECVGLRMIQHAKLEGILSVSTTEIQTMGEVAADLNLPTINGEVAVLNTAVVDGEVSEVADTLSVSDTVLTTTLPNGAKVYHRTICANQIKPEKPPPVKMGKLLVIKTDDGRNTRGLDLPVPGFLIIVDGPVHREGVTDGSGIARFENLPPGTYTVREVNQSGWEPVTPDTVTVEVKAKHAVTVRFKNRQEDVVIVTPTPTSVVTPPPPATETTEPTPRPTATPKPSPTQTPQPPPTSPPPCCPTAEKPPPEDGGTPIAPTFTPTPTKKPPPTPTSDGPDPEEINTPVQLF